MESKSEEKKLKKGFFSRWLDKLDKKMEAKAKSSSGCCKSDNHGEKKSCCS